MSWWCLRHLPSHFTFASGSLYSLSLCVQCLFNRFAGSRELLTSPHYVIDCVTCHLPAQLFCICLLALSVHGEVFVTLRLSEMPALSMLSRLFFSAQLFFFVFFLLMWFSWLPGTIFINLRFTPWSHGDRLSGTDIVSYYEASNNN